MNKDKPAPKPKKNSIVHLIPLQPYAVQFADSDGHIRSYYAFKNPAGKFFLLDVVAEGGLMPAPINVPDFHTVEKLNKPAPLGKPKIMNPPEWLEEKMNDYLAGKKDAPSEEPEEKSDAMSAAMMGEDE